MKHIFKMKNIQKKSLLVASIFTAVIGAGMYISYYVKNVPYENPKIVETLWAVEIILSIIAIYFAKKHFSLRELGFTQVNWKQFYWFFLPTIIIVLMWFNLLTSIDFTTLPQDKMNLFLLVGFTTLLVGFSEELMYRGIVFSAFVRTNKLRAVWVSALVFSLLHSVNYLGGLPMDLVLGQLVATFVFGLFFALIRLRIVSIIPLIIFHFLWDFALIGGKHICI